MMDRRGTAQYLLPAGWVLFSLYQQVNFMLKTVHSLCPPLSTTIFNTVSSKLENRPKKLIRYFLILLKYTFNLGFLECSKKIPEKSLNLLDNMSDNVPSAEQQGTGRADEEEADESIFSTGHMDRMELEHRLVIEKAKVGRGKTMN
jgi:hypothetical protein